MITLLSILLFPLAAEANTQVGCQYVFMGYPFTHVAVVLDENGEPGDHVVATREGFSHKESATPETRAPGEMVHLWISKESPDNKIEMIVYQERQKLGQSVLINHQVPFGKEVWGDCVASPVER